VIESELFGHAQGAFTGATRDKAGLLEVADGGTAFLDEIGEMPVDLQSRLLRFLETGELRRVGATRNVRVDTRIVAATNRDRNSLQQGDRFRSDLYYRLAHAVIVLPPLRHRGDDILLLTEHFLEEASVENGKDTFLSESAVTAIRAHAWPGNIRELKSVIKRAVILAAEHRSIEATDLGLTQSDALPATLIEELAHNERAKIVEALRQTRGSRTDAARLLGIPRTTLINKIRRYGLS
jgi:sigma-54-dependent transcriptional regulator